jgi:hypothetical protein
LRCYMIGGQDQIIYMFLHYLIARYWNHFFIFTYF